MDDSRIFAHLHTVQDLSGKGPVINAIEVIGCCQEISKGLVEKINRLLPDAKVVTITQIADAQIKINRMMSNLSLMFLVIIVFVGGASIANYMYANVFERRREIGTLMALGADSCLVLRMFLLKALILGLAGGVGGYVLGTILAVVLGPQIGRRRGAADAGAGPLGGWHFRGPGARWPVTFPPGAPPGSILVPRSRRSDPC